MNIPIPTWLVAIVLLGAVVYASGGFQGLPSGILLGGEECQFVEPQFGRIACEPLSGADSIRNVAMIQTAWQSDFPSEIAGMGRIYHKYLTCGDDEYAKQCTYVSTTGESNANVYYRVTSDTSNWGGRSAWIYAGSISRGQEKQLTTLNLGQWIHILHKSSSLGSSHTAKEKYIPYGLNVYKSGAKYSYNYGSCDVRVLPGGERDRICTTPNCQYQTEMPKVFTSDIIAFDTWVNFYVYGVPVVEALDKQIVTYGDQSAYCNVNAIYSIDKIDTIGSGCYGMPGNKIASVDCCPDMVDPSGTQICNQQFKWVPLGNDGYTPECYVASQCPGWGASICDSQGGTYTLKNVNCVNEKCIYTPQTVSCCPPDYGCASGYVCDPARGYVCIKQQGPSIRCGDNVCSQPFEDYINCPDDCEAPPSNGCDIWCILSRYLGAFIVALIISAVVVFVLRFTVLGAFLRSRNAMVLSILGLALVLTLLFSVPLALFSATFL